MQISNLKNECEILNYLGLTEPPKLTQRHVILNRNPPAGGALRPAHRSLGVGGIEDLISSVLRDPFFGKDLSTGYPTLQKGVGFRVEMTQSVRFPIPV